MDQEPPERYHKKRKKGARSHFYRCKRQNHISSEEASPLSLPKHWQLSKTDNTGQQYCKIEEDAVTGLCVISSSVVVHSDGTWEAYHHSKKIPSTCEILSGFPKEALNPDVLSRVITILDKANLCPGNPEEEFIEIYSSKGGVIKGERGNGETIAVIDTSTPVIDSLGKQYLQTIRRVNCDILCKSSHHPTPCSACKSLRSTLRSALSRHNSRADHQVKL